MMVQFIDVYMRHTWINIQVYLVRPDDSSNLLDPENIIDESVVMTFMSVF